MSTTAYYRKCSICKQEIPLGGTFWKCSVSTCNRPRVELFFCSVECWDAHLPIYRHRDAGAIEARAPDLAERVAPGEERAEPGEDDAHAARHIDMRVWERAVPDAAELRPLPPTDVLVVASKVKQYIRDRSGLSTSAEVMERLTQHVRAICDQAIREAQRHERKTVLDRDVPQP